MHVLNSRLVAIGLGLGCALILPVATLAQETESADDERSVRSRLTLHGRAVAFTVAAEPDETEARRLLAADGATDVRIRVGRLDTHTSTRVGSFDGGREPEADRNGSSSRNHRHDVYLTRDASGWLLEAEPAPGDASGAGSEMMGTIPLSHRTEEEPVDGLMGAVVPTRDDEGELRLAWGTHRWSAQFGFAPAEGGDGPDGAGGDGQREFEDDLSDESRAIRLAERHETSMQLDEGADISVLYWQGIGSGHDDLDAVDRLEDGDVLRLTEAATLRLRTEVPLRFGELAVPTGNLAPNFPGSYGLWLERTDAGWRLVLNNEPDAWGTQHDREYDVGAVDLGYAREGASLRPLGAAIVPTSDTSGVLVIHWGPHRWTAAFTVGS